jgi:hypothetical protein
MKLVDQLLNSVVVFRQFRNRSKNSLMASQRKTKIREWRFSDTSQIMARVAEKLQQAGMNRSDFAFIGAIKYCLDIQRGTGFITAPRNVVRFAESLSSSRAFKSIISVFSEKLFLVKIPVDCLIQIDQTRRCFKSCTAAEII